MVYPDSNGISRVPPYSGIIPRKSKCFHLRGYHPLWQTFPGPSISNWIFDFPTGLQTHQRLSRNTRTATLAGLTQFKFRLFPFRSPLLWKSLLISFPEGTKMFQFPSLALTSLYIQEAVVQHDLYWVSPFGNPRIIESLLLSEAYRSLPRPSSPSCA